MKKDKKIEPITGFGMAPIKREGGTFYWINNIQYETYGTPEEQKEQEIEFLRQIKENKKNKKKEED